jgi:hypothetical protein
MPVSVTPTRARPSRLSHQSHHRTAFGIARRVGGEIVDHTLKQAGIAVHAAIAAADNDLQPLRFGAIAGGDAFQHIAHSEIATSRRDDAGIEARHVQPEFESVGLFRFDLCGFILGRPR